MGANSFQIDGIQVSKKLEEIEKAIRFMHPQDFFSQQNMSKLVFPPQINNEFAVSSFNQLFPFNSISFDRVKHENNQFTYNYYEPNLKKAQYNPNQASPQYDLFQIQKKRKKQKYKRSTNNSHKKFISAIRRLFYAVISTTQKEAFETKYIKFRSCRTFFFIILAYMRHRFSQKLLNSVRVSFINEMKIKINEYQEEISRTKNVNLKNFREQEIIDIKYSIKSCNEYINGNTRQAIECMYKKDKSTVIKRQHYESALRSVHVIEKQLFSNPRSPLEEPFIEDYSPSSDREKVERKVLKRQIRQNQNAKFYLQKQEQYDFGNQFGGFKEGTHIKMKQLKPTADSDDFEQPQPAQKQVTQEKELLYPPLLQPIPYVKYDPFLPPFKYKRQTKMHYDVRQDFFGYMCYGFPKFQDKNLDFLQMNSQFKF